MSDGERLRQLILSKALRRTIFGVLALISVWFIVRSLEQGSVADRCAESLARAVAEKDRSYFASHVRNPSLEETLLSAPSAELAFVRPVDPEWSRIGFLIKESASSTTAKPVFVLLSHADSEKECSFVQDYE